MMMMMMMIMMMMMWMWMWMGKMMKMSPCHDEHSICHLRPIF
jgi:hypothetical protein